MFLRLISFTFIVFNFAQSQTPKSLSISEAIELALKGNPLIVAAKKRIEAAKGEEVSAKSLPNPSIAIVPIGTTTDNPILLEQVFEFPFKRYLRTKIAESEIDAAIYDYRTVELDVAYNVKIAYLDLQVAVAILRLTEEAFELARTFKDLAQKQHEIGTVPFVHVVRTEIESRRVEQELEQAKTEVIAKQIALNLALGQEPSTPVLPADELSYRPLTISPEELKKLALKRRPEILVAQSKLLAQRFAFKFAQSQKLPDFFLLVRFGESERAIRSSSPRFGIGITLPLLDFGSIKGEIQTAKAKVAEREALLEQTKRIVISEVEIAAKKLAAAQKIVEAYQQKIVPKAEDLLKRVEASYAEGGSTLLEVLDAQQTWRMARKELVQAIANYNKALSELERAIGEVGQMGNGRISDSQTDSRQCVPFATKNH